MLRKVGISLLLVLFFGGVFLHSSYGLDYIARVYVNQESDADDFKWKPKIEFAASSKKLKLSEQLSAERVQEAFVSETEIGDLDEFMEKTGSTSLIVLQDGKLIYDAHYNGHKPGEQVATFSVSKSVFPILLGKSLDREEIADIRDPLTDYIPELIERDQRFSKITLAALIDMRSGIAFDSDISFPFFDEDETMVYYATDLRHTLLNRPQIESAPGKFHYGDFNPNLLALAFERATKETFQERFQKDVWEEIGAQYPAIWSTDYRGFPLVESGFAAAPADLALLGLQMLEAGKKNGSGLISKWWHSRSTTRQEPQLEAQFDGRNWGYRNAWWIIARPNAPADYAAIGHLGQYIYVSPTNNIVIVRTGIDRAGLQDDDFTAIFYNVAERLAH